MSRPLPAILACLAIVGPARWDEPSGQGQPFDRVRPLLESRCIACHGPDRQEGGLRLDSAAALLAPAHRKLGAERKAVLHTFLEAERTTYAKLAGQVEAIRGRKQAHATAVATTDSGKTAPRTHVLAGGDFTRPSRAVPPGFPSILDPNPAAIPETPQPRTGRRAAPAGWIASRDIPLTARVIVDRPW